MFSAANGALGLDGGHLEHFDIVIGIGSHMIYWVSIFSNWLCRDWLVLLLVTRGGKQRISKLREGITDG